MEWLSGLSGAGRLATSAIRPYRCLRCLLQHPSQPPARCPAPDRSRRRFLSTTSRTLADIPKPKSISAAKLGLLNDSEKAEGSNDELEPEEASSEHLENYQHVREYTPQQQEAINLAHDALVTNADKIRRKQKIRPRSDAGAPMILEWERDETGKQVAIREDFSTIDPFLDPVDYREHLRVQRGIGDRVPNFNQLVEKDEADMEEDLQGWLDKLLEPVTQQQEADGDYKELFAKGVDEGRYTDDEAGQQQFFRDRVESADRRIDKLPLTGQELFQYVKGNRMFLGDEVAEQKVLSYESPEIGEWKDPRVTYPDANTEQPEMLRLRQRMLLTKREIRDIMIRPLVTHRVVNQTHMGKIPSIYVLSIAGNGNGLVGIGEGKAHEPDDARKQADLRAIRNMEPIHRYEERTIFGEVHGKVGATELVLMARPPGFGVRTQSLIFEICRMCGITDLAGRVTRSRNKMNTVKATVQALKKQRLPEEMAKGRGKKLVDVRKVYYAGLAG